MWGRASALLLAPEQREQIDPRGASSGPSRGWAARAYDELQLRESEEMRDDREYLERLAAGLRTAGFETEWRLERGDPATQIIRTAGAEHVDLVAMATHGHRLLRDLVLGTTVNRVRHELAVPVLLLRAR